ncbi:hypothetical protein LTR91_007465 [Friedmanniomyces endolithicus]|uniref:Transcription and mRNA export factor SUS1 n=1 Tax=Friedmanniomyces endolithicus TaxID=329885 RepID=A0A4U0V8F6_9PEZI|nr:hypothetical protein LTS09_000551 [Friedmanniomyces endolithicus]KAK0335363.1 hypothetical protein LTR94_013158 [Friedmanniomyces endolithicus]KAK0352247.1 hypothetical protein LTR94_021625 [Friedmanniomyces endolithicus]KAK0772625.1 hypothetical protein LTR59_015603 [Friedmanniomyces endolithicus]KAK0774404.1 hypothetical protein LTR38_016232 [Friedmanniomyces endolithicus]
MANKVVQVNGTTSGHDPNVQSQISTALLQNGGVKRIQQTLQQRLDEEGWSQNLREYIVRLFRSGEATTYDDALGKVMQHIRGSAGEPDLQIPQSAKQGGADAVRRELEKVCVMVDK